MAKGKSICVERLPHSCGSRDGLQVFQQEDGSYDGFCYGCKKYIPNPYEHMPANYAPQIKRRTDEEIHEEMEAIKHLPPPDLTARRGLRLDSLAHYNIHMGVSGIDGQTPELIFFPYTKGGEISAYKVRMLSQKKMWSIGNMRDVEFFGWEQAKLAGGKRLYITEGEFDTVALFQMIRDSLIGTKWAHMTPAVVSLPNGAGSVERVVTRMAHQIRQLFPEVVFVPDRDKAGSEAAEKFARLYPGLFIAELPAKDPNQCLIEGLHEQAVAAIRWRPSIPRNTRIVLGSSLQEEAKKKPEAGRPWPWDGLTKATRGRRRGETYYFGAGGMMPAINCVNSGKLSRRQS